MSTKLCVTNLALQQGSTVLVEGLTCSVQPGETLAVMGPSGVGKSTFLRALTGAFEPSVGTIDRPDGRIGMVFQDHRLLPWKTARDNVMLTALPTPTTFFDAEEWLDAVGLVNTYDLYPHQLSGGMRQRVSIARALAHQPTMLLVDEPFSALDQAIAVELRFMLSTLIQQLELVTVWVTHNPDEATAVASHILHFTGVDSNWKLASNPQQLCSLSS